MAGPRSKEERQEMNRRLWASSGAGGVQVVLQSHTAAQMVLLGLLAVNSVSTGPISAEQKLRRGRAGRAA